MSKLPSPVTPEFEEVATQVGEFIEYFGFKKVHGRIWTHLFLSTVSLDATDLVERLKISKALVSTSISDLLSYEVIEVAGKGARGTTAYRASPHLTQAITKILRIRERRMLARVSSAVRLLKTVEPAPTVSSERIDVLSSMVSSAEDILDSILVLGQADFQSFAPFMNIQNNKK